MINKFKQLISEKKYGKIAIIATCILIAIAIIVLVTFYVGKLLIENFDTIALGIAIVSVAFYYIHKYFANREDARLHNAAHRMEVKEAAEKQQREAELISAESSYNTVRKCLYTVLCETASTLNLVAPKSYTALDSNVHTSDNGRFVILHYVCQKNGDIDTAVISEVLNMRIGQKLSAGDFTELSTSAYIYEGRSYPILMINGIVDVGAYINIDVVICNEAYCEYLRNKSNSGKPPFDHNDKDF